MRPRRPIQQHLLGVLFEVSQFVTIFATSDNFQPTLSIAFANYIAPCSGKTKAVVVIPTLYASVSTPRKILNIRVSHLIPLYNSARFHDVIVANIEALNDPDDEIILSDRNGDKDYCDRLIRMFAGRANLRVILSDDNAHWVENIAGLIAAARGRFLRILPHDDSTDSAGVKALVEILLHESGAAVAFGQTIAIGLDGQRIPERDELNLTEGNSTSRWVLDDILPMFWTGRFSGAFKGLIRSEIAKRDALRFRATPGLMHSERAWLLGLGLAGAFRFVPTVVLTKRYYPESTHRSWVKSPKALTDVADLMADYAKALLPSVELVDYAGRDLALNAANAVAALRPGAARFAYQPAPDPMAVALRGHPLPGHIGAGG